MKARIRHNLFSFLFSATALLFALTACGISDDSDNKPSCTRHYNVVDSNGNPIHYIDNGGVTKPLKISGREYKDITPPSDRAAEVTAAGGRMVQEIDGGRSTRRFNCAGWTFRELHCHG